MYWVVSYDIADNAIRRRVAKILEAIGTRVQYSVFEIELSLLERKNLEEKIAEHIWDKKDSVRWYPQCHACMQKTRFIGAGRYLEQGKDYILF